MTPKPAPEPQGWQPIATAGKGSWLTGPNDTRHPDYVEPPRLWLLLEDGESCVGYADAYYAEGGSGYDGGPYWVEKFSGERVNPTHWMPLPAAPASAPAAPVPQFDQQDDQSRMDGVPEGGPVDLPRPPSK